MPGIKEKSNLPKSAWSDNLELALESFQNSDAEDVLKFFDCDRSKGLGQAEAKSRLLKVGPNRQSKAVKIKPLKIFLHQFESSVVVLLLLAALASFCYKENLQAAGILVAVLINAITGFYMEYKAGLSLAGLEELSGQTIRSIRQGEQCELPVADLVPGDLVILEAGARVPADLRLIDAAGLCVDESPLTGESVPVFKEVSEVDQAASGRISQAMRTSGIFQAPANAAASIGEYSNMALQGTLIAGGRGLGVVVKTGNNASLGKLGKLLESTDSGATPLESQLEELGRQLSILTVVICSVVTAVGVLHQENFLLMVETGIALAVAAIPEGLPVLATLALAVGTQRMVRHRAILRHLAAVETLGCTSVICTDKTGTLTENRMTACKLYVKDRLLEVSGTGYAPVGNLIEKGVLVDSPIKDELLKELFVAAGLCNDATLEDDGGDVGWHVHGDPTEGALLTLVEKAGLKLSTLHSEQPRVLEIPFDLARKRMTTVHQITDAYVAYSKGAPGLLLQLCSKILTEKGEIELSSEMRDLFVKENERLAMDGLRVLAFARKHIHETPLCVDDSEIESKLTLLGLIALKDPPKEGVREAIQQCKRAGVRVIMLTGDQVLTAAAVGKELGLIENETRAGETIAGKELEGLDSAGLKKAMESASVLARVTPELKLQIVKVLQELNNVVSMTGDGVNDAPALKQANIGVAMGQTGTDLARSVSQMVITDDNFSTIVKAIEQGRIIYGNIQRAVGYLLTASFASVITVALGILFDVGLPLSPIQLLWLNLIMHIFPGLGIVLQRADATVMAQPPRNSASKLISGPERMQIFMRSAVVSLAVILAVFHAERITQSFGHTTTVGLCTLSLCLLFQAWAWLGVQTNTQSIKPAKTEIGTSMFANMAVAYALLFVAIYWTPLAQILNTVALNASEMAYCVCIAVASLIGTSVINFTFGLLKTQSQK